MRQNENNKGNVLVTGATSGIGYELSKIFAEQDFNLILVARNQERLVRVANEISSSYSVQTMIITSDLSNPGAPTEIFSQLQQQRINVDILVNNAGFSEYGMFVHTNMERELQMIQVNVTALTYLTKLVLPAMVKRNDGKILNIASIASYGPGPLSTVYCATKAYVLSFSEALAEELENTNITVTALCPGPTQTEFAQKAKIEDVKLFRGTVMQADEVARIGFQALMSGKRTVIAGCRNKLTIFSLRFISRKFAAKIGKDMMSKR